MLAYALHEIRIHDFIKVRIPKEDRPDGFNDDDKDLVITTPGRLIFNYAIPRNSVSSTNVMKREWTKTERPMKW